MNTQCEREGLWKYNACKKLRELEGIIDILAITTMI